MSGYRGHGIGNLRHHRHTGRGTAFRRDCDRIFDFQTVEDGVVFPPPRAEFTLISMFFTATATAVLNFLLLFQRLR